MNVLFDTCVIMDLILQREPFFNSAKTLFDLIDEDKIIGYVTVKSLVDIHFFIKRVTHNEEQTRLILNNLCSVLYVLDSNATIAKESLSSKITDYEDAIMANTAEYFEMEYIVTRNIKDFKNSIVQAITPEDLINTINE